jgi:hypothetical protein
MFLKHAEYQNGPQKDFENIKAYIRARDHYKCQNPNCNNTNDNVVLHVHHIKYGSNGGPNSPNNLITICDKCHVPEAHLPGGFLYNWQQNVPKLKTFKAETCMSVIKSRVIKEFKNEFLIAEETFGNITKIDREELGLNKTHYNDAFVIAKGKNQIKAKPFEVIQKRRNNRKLEHFYDAKYIDSRTGEKVSGGVLNCGRFCKNINKNNENLRKYRKKKVSSGHRNIRVCRYFYQAGDLVKIDDKICIIVGSRTRYRNKWGWHKTVQIKGSGKEFHESVVKPYRFQKGFVFN